METEVQSSHYGIRAKSQKGRNGGSSCFEVPTPLRDGTREGPLGWTSFQTQTVSPSLLQPAWGQGADPVCQAVGVIVFQPHVTDGGLRDSPGSGPCQGPLGGVLRLAG